MASLLAGTCRAVNGKAAKKIPERGEDTSSDGVSSVGPFPTAHKAWREVSKLHRFRPFRAPDAPTVRGLTVRSGQASRTCKSVVRGAWFLGIVRYLLRRWPAPGGFVDRLQAARANGAGVSVTGPANRSLICGAPCVLAGREVGPEGQCAAVLGTIAPPPVAGERSRVDFRGALP